MDSKFNCMCTHNVNTILGNKKYENLAIPFSLFSTLR